MEVAAREMDRLLWAMVERAAGLSIPQQEEGRGVECTLQLPVHHLSGRSYQACIRRTSVRHGGLGIRSMVDTSLAAFFGGMEQPIPHLVGQDGVRQQLAPQLGAVRGARRCEHLLRSGCRTGRELSGMWMTGVTCKLITTHLKDSRFRVLKRALELHPDQCGLTPS